MNHRFRAAALSSFALALGVVAGACDRLLEVDQRDVITPEAVNDAAGAEALRAGAVGRLTFAVATNSTASLFPIVGSLADEFAAASTRPGLLAIDQRIVTDRNDENNAGVQFQRLHQARQAAVQATSALQRFAPARSGAIGQMYAIQGYTELFLGENFCSGIPFSEVVGGVLEYGQPLPTEQVFERALAHFDLALAAGREDAAVGHLARIGRARALLNLGRFAEANAAVSGADSVPAGYRYNLEHSATTPNLQNGIFGWTLGVRIFTVADRKGGNGLPFRSAGDPRVELVPGGVGQDGRTPVFGVAKFSSFASPTPLATGIEAGLIRAEARLQAGDAVGWLTILNDLRATVPGLAPLEDPGDAAARLDLQFSERAFWLFGTGHRLNDLRRLVRQYGQPQEGVFPVGDYPRGGSFGTEVTLPLPIQEQNNPHVAGCLNRNA